MGLANPALSGMWPRIRSARRHDDEHGARADRVCAMGARSASVARESRELDRDAVRDLGRATPRRTTRTFQFDLDPHRPGRFLAYLADRSCSDCQEVWLAALARHGRTKATRRR